MRIWLYILIPIIAIVLVLLFVAIYNSGERKRRLSYMYYMWPARTHLTPEERRDCLVVRIERAYVCHLVIFNISSLFFKDLRKNYCVVREHIEKEIERIGVGEPTEFEWFYFKGLLADWMESKYVIPDKKERIWTELSEEGNYKNFI